METHIETTTEENRAYEFAKLFGVTKSETWIGTDPIKPDDDMTDGTLGKISNPGNGVTGMSNVVALFFDIDDWDHSVPSGLIDNTRYSVESTELAEDGEAVILTSEFGSTARMTTRYFDDVREFLGFDDEAAFLDCIRMNGTDEFPIIFHDQKTTGTVILAPRLPPEKQE